MAATTEIVLLLGSLLMLVSIVVSKTSSRLGVPTLLLFLIVGMVFGSDGLGLQFHSAGTAQFIGTISLSVILFSGGMDTKIKEIRPIITPGLLLSTLGVALTTAFTGLFIFAVSNLSFTNIHFSLIVSLLLAATMSSTDSASVFNILRSQKMNLKNNLRPMLELESGSNDPMAYMLTILLLQVIQAERMTAWTLLGSLLIQFIVGIAAGVILGKLATWFINKINLNNTSLYPLLTLTILFLTYAITHLCHGNGFLAVYIAGIVVGNSPLCHRRDSIRFLDGMTWLFQIIMFLTLGLLVNPHEMLDVTLVASMIGIFLIVFARPLSVMLCLLPFRRSRIDWSSRIFISWVGLRGAAPIIFATYPVIAQIDGYNQIFNIVFFITLLSLLIQGTSIPWVAKLLHLDAPYSHANNSFGIELPEEIGSSLHELVLTDEILSDGNHIADLNFPSGTLVMMIRRGDKHIVPNGKISLKAGDVLLIIKKDNEIENVT